MNDLKGFELLVSVARTGSFTETAKLKGLTAAAVSKIVSRLEREIGVRFFSRTTRQVTLTKQGRIFVEKTTAGLEQFDEAICILRQEMNEPIGQVRITTNAAFGKELILPLLPHFFERHPKVDLEICFNDGVLDLVKEGFDIGIQTQPKGEGSYISRLLCKPPLALIASPAYLKRYGKPSTPEDLEHHQCINVRLRSGQLAQWEFVSRQTKKRRNAQAGSSDTYLLTPRGRLLVSDQYDAIVNSALTGLGITVVYAHSVLRYLRHGELKVLLPDFEVGGESIENNGIYIRYPHRTFLPSATRAFADFLTEHFKMEENSEFDWHRYAA
jgi:DNA-binding transcriptional LysR family regulator